MEVVVYKARGKNGYLYDLSFNPYVDFEILKNTRNIKSLEVLTPGIPFEIGEDIIKKIYGKSIFKKFISSHDYFIKRGLRRVKVNGIRENITHGINIPPKEDIAKVEECIQGKVVAVKSLLYKRGMFGLTQEQIMDIIQILYCERRIKIVPARRKHKGSFLCSFCERPACGGCKLGFEEEDVLLYAADNYNTGVPRSLEYKTKKLNEVLGNAMESLNSFINSTRRNYAVLWCVPGSFDYNVLSKALLTVLRTGEKILYITATSLMLEVKQELGNTIESVSIEMAGKDFSGLKDTDIVISSYNDYPCFHKSFDLVIYDERIAFSERPLSNMLSISRRAVKEAGKFVNITCFPDLRNRGFKAHSPELITIPVSYTRCPMPEPLIVITRLLKESMPQMVMDTIKWSVSEGFKLIIFIPGEEGLSNVYFNIINVLGMQKELVDFSSLKDKTALLKLKRKEIQIVISTDYNDSRYNIEDLNVIVLGADAPVYKRDTLLYMASMAGFHTKKRCGQVIFAVERDTDEVSIAKERIRGINKIAWENGYLKK